MRERIADRYRLEAIIGEGGYCDGDHTVTKPNAETVDCSPHECDPDGGCRVVCDSIEQCTPGHVCSASYRCVSQNGSAEEDESGCGCKAPGSSRRQGPAALGALLAALGMAIARRRRFRHRGCEIAPP